MAKAPSRKKPAPRRTDTHNSKNPDAVAIAAPGVPAPERLFLVAGFGFRFVGTYAARKRTIKPSKPLRPDRRNSPGMRAGQLDRMSHLRNVGEQNMQTALVLPESWMRQLLARLAGAKDKPPRYGTCCLISCAARRRPQHLFDGVKLLLESGQVKLDEDDGVTLLVLGAIAAEPRRQAGAAEPRRPGAARRRHCRGQWLSASPGPRVAGCGGPQRAADPGGAAPARGRLARAILALAGSIQGAMPGCRGRACSAAVTGCGRCSWAFFRRFAENRRIVAIHERGEESGLGAGPDPSLRSG